MLEREAAVAQGRAVFERYRSGVRSSRTPATGCRAGAPATPATTRATPVTALPGGGAVEGSAQSFLLRAVASTPAPTAAHHEEAAHRRELCDLLATQAALIDEARLTLVLAHQPYASCVRPVFGRSDPRPGPTLVRRAARRGCSRRRSRARRRRGARGCCGCCPSSSRRSARASCPRRSSC